MIEILTIFVGLYVGQHPVELAVDETIAAVEIRLDGQLVDEYRVDEYRVDGYRVDQLDGEPWKLDIDFGPSLSPHRLEAVGFDHLGRELGRHLRWVNLSRGTYGAGLELMTGETGRPEAVSLRWESLGSRGPQHLEVRFNGDALKVPDPRRIVLPAYDPEAMHLVEADLFFGSQEVARLVTTFGGALGEQLEAELTAVAVEVEGTGRRLGEEVAFRFRSSSAPIVVHGVEKGPAEVVFVIDPALDEIFEGLEDRLHERSLADYASLGSGDRLRLLGPRAAPLTAEHLTPGMFQSSAWQDAGEGGFLWLFQDMEIPQLSVHFADSVALAGLAAQASNRRRAVVLLLGEEQEDGSLFDPAKVRAFLHQLQVPLLVWSVVGRDAHPAWGPAEVLDLDIGKSPALGPLRAAMRNLRRDLERQRIVWLVGQHLPQNVTMISGRRKIELAGRSQFLDSLNN